MKNIFLALVFVVSGFVFADSIEHDKEKLQSCVGSVSLREAENGDYSLYISSYYCKNLVLMNTSGKVIKSYKLEGEQPPYKGTFTLSKKIRLAAGRDGRVKFVIRSNSGAHEDSFNMYLGAAENTSRSRDYAITEKLPNGWAVSYDLLGLLLGIKSCVLYDHNSDHVALLENNICEDRNVTRYRRLPRGWVYSWSISGDCNLYDGEKRWVSQVSRAYCR